jgi:TupA-like ATPgrasp
MRIKELLKDLTPDSVVQIRKWRNAHGVFPRIFRPVTFSEKVLHRNLFERRDEFKQIADKAAVRSYVERRLGPEILPKLYHLTGDPDSIPFDELPSRFVVKPTHGSGWVRVVTDKSTLDRAGLIAVCADWLKRSYYRESREIVYKGVEPRILVEEFIDDGNGATPNDYKLFVFGGSVEYIQADLSRFDHHKQLLYSPAWKKLDVRYVGDDISGEVERPPHLREMIEAAEMLGRDWDFIRADFYDTAGRLYFGEITLTPNEGCVRFRPQEFDDYLGSLWKVHVRTAR